MKFLKILFTALLCAYLGPDASGQMPDATANFVKVEKEITTTPKFPGICNPDKGILVTIDETFERYLWTSQNGTIKEGKTVTLNEPSNWTIEVEFVENGVVCIRTKILYVADLGNSFEIRKYFVDAGFWPIQIYRQTFINPLLGVVFTTSEHNLGSAINQRQDA